MKTLNERRGHGLSTEQLDLLYQPKNDTIETKFWAYHEANPKTYRKIVNLCREVKGAGHEHFSMDAIFHRLRWYMVVEAKTKEPFKLNDHYTSFYARLVAKQEPDLCDFFEMRKQRTVVHEGPFGLGRKSA